MEKPIGRKVTSVHPLVGTLSFVSTLKDQALGKDVSGRSWAMIDEIGNITIDTCVPSDTGVWETGIRREEVEGKWVIVGQYESDEEAEKGHKDWVTYIKENPTCELEDIDSWNLKPSETETS